MARLHCLFMIAMATYTYQTSSLKHWDVCYPKNGLLSVAANVQKCYDATRRSPENDSRVTISAKSDENFSFKEFESHIEDNLIQHVSEELEIHEKTHVFEFRRATGPLDGECELLRGFCQTTDENHKQQSKKIIDKYNLYNDNNIILDRDDELSLNLGSELCDFVEQVVEATLGRDVFNISHLIVNGDPPLQKFKFQKCKSKEPNLSVLHVYRKGICEQKFMLRDVLTIGDNEEIKTTPIWVPSCCTFYFTQQDD